MADVMARRGPVHLGIDIGGTKTLAVAVDADGTVIEQARLETGHGARAVLETATSAILEVARTVGVSLVDVASIGIGVPGRVDIATGVVAHAVNLGFDSLDLGEQLTKRLGVRVHVENDVNSAALGAYHRLAAEGDFDHSMAYLNLGTGLAAGIVVGGRLRRGARGTAGEIGHIAVDPTGVLCPCGQRGCLEVTASGSAIQRLWPRTGARLADASLVHSLKGAVDSRDATATAVWEGLLHGVASAVSVLVLTVDVDTVVIGGGIASIGEPLLEGVRSHLSERAATSSFIASLELSDRVRLVPENFPAAAIGAAYVARDAAELEDAA